MSEKDSFDEHAIDRRAALKRLSVLAAGAVAAPAVLARAAAAQAGSVSAPTGAFVIGDLEAQVGNKVTFWGAQWAKQNALSSGSAPASFKGYASNVPVVPPQCGDTWTGAVGNSTKPPATVDSLIYVIVAGSISESGAVVSGDTTSIALVQTDPGYGPNPGHAGTGTVVAAGCYLTRGSSSGSGSSLSSSGGSLYLP